MPNLNKLKRSLSGLNPEELKDVLSIFDDEEEKDTGPYEVSKENVTENASVDDLIDDKLEQVYEKISIDDFEKINFSDIEKEESKEPEDDAVNYADEQETKTDIVDENERKKEFAVSKDMINFTEDEFISIEELATTEDDRDDDRQSNQSQSNGFFQLSGFFPPNQAVGQG